MSKKKSLGSSPIGFHSENSTLGFIPDLGVSKSKERTTQTHTSREGDLLSSYQDKVSDNPQKPEKKIVSYNLEINLIDKLKSMADQKGMYYSALVSKALKKRITENA